MTARKTGVSWSCRIHLGKGIANKRTATTYDLRNSAIRAGIAVGGARPNPRKINVQSWFSRAASGGLAIILTPAINPDELFRNGHQV
jgi:hypothetical protein